MKSLWALLLVGVHSLFSENVLQRLLLEVSWHMPLLHSNLVFFVSQSNVGISVRENSQPSTACNDILELFDVIMD